MATLFDVEVATAQARPRLIDALLYKEEWQYIRHASARRRAEFGTARLCARQALQTLGLPACTLPPDHNRIPQWPVGTVGSIAHTDNLCAAVVAYRGAASSLGFDMEVDGRVDAHLEPVVCTPREQRWLDKHARENRTKLATLLFSAKEAWYKCQYPLTGCFFEFTDVEMQLDLAQRTFHLRWASNERSIAAEVTRIHGRFRHHAGLVFTGATLR